MIKRIITLGTLFFTILSNAQMNAVTENGDEVMLYKDNTWKYSNDSLNDSVELLKNDKLFIKDQKSSFLVKSSKTNAGIWINPKNWTFEKSKSDSSSEFNFYHKNLDIYGMLISEKMEVPVESLVDIAYDNALEAAPDIKIIEKEYRNVNGLEVIMMKMEGTIQGIKFVYFGYYYSNLEGAYQFLTYTSQNLFNEYEDDMIKLLDGLTEY
jgi:hypothetical protein|tara:strand:+ start:285 stop:914 length:630 start_codon:yes stop_codon:yes gene_type:complete